MANQESFIKFTGTLDGISFYRRKGKYVARKAGGPSRETLLTNPRCQRTRENISEFGAMSKALKAFRQLWIPTGVFPDSMVRSKMSKVFHSMLSQAPGIRGQRPIEISKYRHLLKNIDVQSAAPFDEVWQAPYLATHSLDRTTATINIQNITPTQIIAPHAATSYRLFQLLACMPDIIFSDSIEGYQVASKAYESVSAITYSPYHSLGASPPVSVAISTTLVNPPILSPNVSVVQAIGIIFYQQIGNQYYPLGGNRATKIIDIF